jgi:sterol desaturase/sphingolipid hydroxylase (fatty acid hydroxylase superfamily)
MWASHVIHHSSEHFNFSTALRNASIGALYKPFLWVWMTVLGFHPLMVLSCMAIETVYQFFLHTKSLPAWDRLSAVMNTPGLHEVHHGKDPFCIDKNYGGMTIIFDRLFGTYQPIQSNQQIQFGVTHPPHVQSILEITLHEFRSLFNDIVRCKSIWIAIQYAVNRPGWKPQSAKHTADVQRCNFLSRWIINVMKLILPRSV